jgi:hypothetical protein
MRAVAAAALAFADSARGAGDPYHLRRVNCKDANNSQFGADGAGIATRSHLVGEVFLSHGASVRRKVSVREEKKRETGHPEHGLKEERGGEGGRGGARGGGGGWEDGVGACWVTFVM